jgi:adenine-specific DNA-methyltransferase
VSHPAADEILQDLADQLSLMFGSSLISAPVVSRASGRAPEQRLMEANSRQRRRELGQIFTPEPVARFMADVLLANGPLQHVLDPAVGGGVLLRVLPSVPNRYGLDIDPKAIELAREGLADPRVLLARGDFLRPHGWRLPKRVFDGIIANPPYIRHQALTAATKSRGAHYSKLFDVDVSSLSGSYAYFFLEAIKRLRPGGRLVFITPAEYLDTRYGTAVKQVLQERCHLEEVVVLDLESMAFAGVPTTSAITIATKRQPRPRGGRQTSALRLVDGRSSNGKNPSEWNRLSEASFEGDVVRRESVDWKSAELPAHLPWTTRLPSRERRRMPLLVGRTATLGEYAKVRRGTATGDNTFFCLTQADVAEWGIEQRFLVPIIYRARDLPVSEPLTKAHWRKRLLAGSRGYLLWCDQPKEELVGTRLLAYLEEGERRGVPARYNCVCRDPWYQVERVPPGDFFATYMNRGRPRFIENQARVRCMTTLLNVWVRDGVSRDALAKHLRDPATAQLLAEQGRTYGRGLSKIEPKALLDLPLRPLVQSASRSAR